MTGPSTNSEDSEVLAKQVAAWRAEVARLNDLIAHATGASQVPAEQQESIDTPEFRSLLIAARLYGDDPTHYTEGKDALVAYIDAHTAATVANAREEGFEDGKRLAHEQACKVTHTLMGERDEWKQRATAAEAKLEAIRQGVRECVGFGFDKDGPNWISRQQVLSLFQQQPQADERGLPG